MELTRLFTPITIRNLELKNRVMMPAIHHLYTPDGYATERFNKYYWRRAEGGAALIFVGGCRFDEYGGTFDMMSLQSDEFIPGYKEFSDGMHARGAKVGVQLYHAGRYAHRGANEGSQPLAPSVVYSNFSRDTPREMTIEEIKDVIKKGAAAAVRAKKAGFDIVELVGSAGYLISQFLSPITNMRTDEYGGSWENRVRFAKEYVSAVREAVGEDYPISMRIAGHDLVAGSNTNEDAVEFAKIMEEAGIDMLNVTGGWHESVVPQITGDLPRGGFAYLTAAVKAAVKIPVAASNRINDPVVAEKILALGEADLISAGRPLIADPDWVNKAKAGLFTEIRKCVACNQGCIAKAFFNSPVECLVNGMAGREYLYNEVCSPELKRNILVVGAGPAGCEFAVQAAKQGHNVTLWEKENKIGGQLHMVAAPPGKKEFISLIQYYEAMLKKYEVEVILNKEADTDSVVSGGFDTVVTATGIIPNRIPVSGGDKTPVYTAYDILQRNVIAGKDIVIIGGGAVGCETAQYLAHEASLSEGQVYHMLEHKYESAEKIAKLMNTNRRAISIVDIAKIGAGFEPGTGWPVFKDLRRLNVNQYSFAKIFSVKDNFIVIEAEVEVEENKRLSQITIPCDTIILAVGAKPNNLLFTDLQKHGIVAYNLGDSSKVGKVLDAIREAGTLVEKLSYAGRAASEEIEGEML